MKNFKILLSAVLCLMMLAGLTACGTPAATTTTTAAETTTVAETTTAAAAAEGVWADALYTEDTELGEGAITVKVTVEAEDKKVVFTLHTDKTILGDALLDNKLVEGEEGPYGLYIKKVNGMLADYDVDQTYWAFNKGGEAMMTGVDGQTIADGEAYELVRTK